MPSKPLDFSEDELPTPSTQNNGSAELAKAIVQAMQEAKGVQKVPYGKQVDRSAFNPTGKKRSLSRPMFVNGFQLYERTLSDEEIGLLEKVKSGQYINKLVEVKEIEHGGVMQLHIFKRDGTINDRMVLAGHAPTFAILLQKLIAEAATK